MKKFLKQNWIKLAETITVIWAIERMWRAIHPKSIFDLGSENSGWLLLLFYFLTTILILYLLRRFEKIIIN